MTTLEKKTKEEKPFYKIQGKDLVPIMGFIRHAKRCGENSKLPLYIGKVILRATGLAVYNSPFITIPIIYFLTR